MRRFDRPDSPSRPLRALRRLTAEKRELGTSYALASAAKRLADLGVRLADLRVVHPLELLLMRIEAERGFLGPALSGYQRHAVSLNRDTWTTWDWRKDAEDWTPSPEWKQSVLDGVLFPLIPEGGTVLEIGPGGGRWSSHLKELAAQLILVDVTERALELCRERLGDDGVSYVLSSGSDFPGVSDASVDAIWSFDVFVHIAPADIAGYLREVARVLRSAGTAVIHHSGRLRHVSREGWRSPMTARLFARLAEDSGLRVERQFDTWPGDRTVYNDVITVLSGTAS